MILLEHEAKTLLRSHNLPVPNSELLDIATPLPVSLSLPLVVKSQVPTGGRGKLGGIMLVSSDEAYASAIATIPTTDIKGFLPSHLLVEEKIVIKNELYLSIRFDRTSQSLQLLAHPDGGIEIEDHAIDSFFVRTLTTPPSKQLSDELSAFYQLPESIDIHTFITNLYRCYLDSDALLIEINPLIITKENTLVAGDCKMELDDAAGFRHPDWNFTHQASDANFVEINKEGLLGTVANGAGLAMATLDATESAGLQPINFLDVGGGANEAALVKVFTQLAAYPNIRGIVINIFAGITRCDEVARAIISASEQREQLPTLYIRLSGTNHDEAKQLLDEKGISLFPDLKSCLLAAKGDLI